MVLNFFALIFGICCSILSSPEQKNPRFGKGTEGKKGISEKWCNYQSNGDLIIIVAKMSPKKQTRAVSVKLHDHSV